MVGVAAAFSGFNCHPAKMIMGDNGALTRRRNRRHRHLLQTERCWRWWVACRSQRLGHHPVSDSAERKRIFAMSPLHHHSN